MNPPAAERPPETVQLDAAERESAEEEMAALTYNQARTALELVLKQLQASDLDVEAMATLYRRGLGYARHCASILETVEQDVLLWDATADEGGEPKPYSLDAQPEDRRRQPITSRQTKD